MQEPFPQNGLDIPVHQEDDLSGDIPEFQNNDLSEKLENSGFLGSGLES